MKRAALLLVVLTAFAAPTRAGEDKVSADILGEVEVQGISEAGALVGDEVPSYRREPARGKVSVVAKEGRVHRVETYVEWQAINGVRARVWEKLYVSGGTYTGWSERLIETPAAINFSRNVIDGAIEQEIDSSGRGFIEWTVAGADQEIETADDADFTTDPSDGDLPTVEILEEGELSGVSDRRIEIQSGGDRPTVTFRDAGYTNALIAGSTSGQDPDEADDAEGETVVVNQKFRLEGRGGGSLQFDPKETEASPTPTPAPSATATPTPTAEIDDF